MYLNNKECLEFTQLMKLDLYNQCILLKLTKIRIFLKKFFISILLLFRIQILIF